ncbi:MAG: hypothetical protein AAF613_10020, partial [Pseudomonadota bacterium]
GVTSLVDLGRPIGMADADHALRDAFERIFESETTIVAPPRLSSIPSLSADGPAITGSTKPQMR